AIGWCAFDYNTHKDFGSGDRICYHGVMDMFRLPKFAASVYGSQVAPEKKVVLKPVTFWARGERSIGGVFPLVILTNCDSVSIQFGKNEPIVVTEKEESFSHLPYPPFVIDTRQISMEKIGAWGMRWEDLTLTGFIDGKEVAVVRMPKDPVPSNLSVVVDDSKLNKGEKDVSRVIVSIQDQYGNTLPLADPVVSVEITGPARIQGPKVFALKGGSSAFWVETNGTAGDVKVSISTPGFEQKTIGITVL
ncbi:MAG TPA: glycoside hydrolase family 2 protein, partial [Treponemataceae bacterium]|nr:glycoside hydrolase family 2 protein [Treponemataceae bacterium]